VSTLYLIRHGQASFLDADYDVLSERGVAQSRRLGSHVAAGDWRFDAIYTGPRKRQIDTATHMIDAAREGGRELPAPEVLDAFDEFPFEAMMREVVPRLLAGDPELARMVGDRTAGDEADRRRRLTAFVEHVTNLWSAGELEVPDHIESFERFNARVGAGLDDVMRREGRGRRVAVVTSGGPISISLRRALALSADVMWQTAWVIRNASVSEFRYRDDAFGLVSLNAVPRLSGDLITYR